MKTIKFKGKNTIFLNGMVMMYLNKVKTTGLTTKV